MRLKALLFAVLSTLSLSAPVSAAETFLNGKVVNVTSIETGVLIQFENGAVPGLCEGFSSYGWMIIEEENTAMISVFLSHYLAGRFDAAVYVNPNALTASGYCRITQYDPRD